MTEGLVSVIIPVRNAEEYVRVSVRSVLDQSYSNLEVIIILNDSHDKSEAICEEIASIDGRVRLVSVGEPGVSNARNVGLEMVSGEYVMFVDADDFIYSELIDRLVREMYQQHSDICTTGIEKYDPKLLGSDRDTKTSGVVTSHMYVERMLLGSRGYYGYACCKLYKTASIGEIRFDITLKFSEDTDFLMRVLGVNRRVFLSSLVGYFYSQDSNGVTRDDSGEKRIKSLSVAKKFLDSASSKSIAKASACYYWRNAYYTITQSNLSTANKNEVWSMMSMYRVDVIMTAGSPVKYRVLALASFLGVEKFLKIMRRLK